MKLLNPWILLVALVAIGSAGGLGYYYGGKHKEDAMIASQKRAEDLANDAAAKAIAGVEIKHTTIRTRVEERIREVPVYRDAHCNHDPDVFLRLNEALSNKPFDPSLVPHVDTPPGPESRSDNP